MLYFKKNLHFKRLISLISVFLIFTNFVFGQKSELTNKINSLYNTIENSTETDSLKIEKIVQFSSQNNYPKAIDTLLKKAVEIAKKNGSISLLAHVYRMYGNYYFYNSKMDSAKYYLLKAKEKINNINNPYLEVAIRTPLSGVYRKQGNITMALATLMESKAILDKTDLSKFNASFKRKLIGEKLILYNSLANFFNQLDEKEKAIANYDKAYKMALALQSKKYAGVILNNKADLLLKQNKNNEALTTLLQAKKLKKEGNASAFSIANTNQNIGLAYMKLGNYKKALKNIDIALDFFAKNKITSGIMEASAIKSRILYFLKDYNQSVIYGLKSKEIALKNKDIEGKSKACKYLSDSYEKLGKYKLALQNYKAYKQATDKIFNEKNIKKITQIEMQANFEREKEIQKIKTENQKKQSKTTIKLLIISVIALFLIAGLLFRVNAIKRKNNEKLKGKNKQISEALAINKVLFKETHHRVKNNLQIINSLLNMQQHFVTDEKSKKIVVDSQNRIKSMSLIHQKLYQNKVLTGIETKSYFSDLIESLCDSYGIQPRQITLKIESLLLDVDTAIPMGLIVNEIISNSFKHAFTDEKSALLFELFLANNSELIVIVRDNGKGIKEDFDFKKSLSYGMKIIHSLAKKIKATILFTNKDGLEVKLIIKRFKIIHSNA